MFDSKAAPRLFAIPVGADFARVFVDGLLKRFEGHPPEALARVEIFVNTRRMERRVHTLLLQQGALLLPRVRLITDISGLPGLPIDLPAPVSGLRRRLLLAQLVKVLLMQQPDLAPQSAVFDLAGSLATLLDEMQGEGVAFELLEEIKTGELSGHWERSLGFLRILASHWDPQLPVDPQDRQRVSALALAGKWVQSPPDHPVVVAGSTGSRGASALFMRAVASLPQGAVVLPGVDTELSPQAWADFEDKKVSMDHPQASLFKFCKGLNCNIYDLPSWQDFQQQHVARNRLVSLALRPAPFTDQWLAQGPALIPALAEATGNVSMIIADTQKDEARAVALRLRKAAEEGQAAVLISPDRELTRRVTAALLRWGILPDDSAGRPLHQTPPGILLRLTAGCFGQRLTPLALVSMLKHPLCARAKEGGDYRLLARNLERTELRGGAPFVDFNRISIWADKSDKPETRIWAGWLRQMFEPLQGNKTASLSEWLARHRTLAENLASGPETAGSGTLWEREAGKQAVQVFDKLEREADAAADMSAAEYNALFSQVLHEGEVRESITPHPQIAIMGPREAREQGAELVILAGLNEGVWPKLEAPDPWLNRSMRQQIGLPPPERQIGLSAHDFQQAISAPKVVLSRAARVGDAPSVASRWLIRLTNLLNGLGEEGKTALQEMQQRGDELLALAGLLDRPKRPVLRANRPAPCPPVKVRPRRLSVTRIKTLIRDPYAIYASSILGLKRIDPLGKQPDALARGIALHEVLEQFITQTIDNMPPDATSVFLQISAEVLEKEAPWPAERRFWLARLARIADWFVTSERSRREKGRVLVQERKGERRFEELDFLLTAKADRIDLDTSGSLLIYDYKSGAPPSKGVIENFDKQLQLEAAIAEAGGFDGVEVNSVSGLQYIGLGSSPHESVGKVQPIEIEADLAVTVWNELRQLITAYQAPEQGYSARARMQKDQDYSDYDHLSRRGEWEDSDEPVSEQVP
ncbi:MAG: double-strand break repair protein AddB [Rhodobacteraceae bacterium]|nr:double-strand break repair protein AddB [Paracoccaceae bacterium]